MISQIKKYPKHKRSGGWIRERFKLDIVSIRRRVCKESYFEYVKTFWHEVVPETPVWNWHIRIMSQEIQKSAEYVFRMDPKPYDLVCNVPPGSTKSTVFSILPIGWLWARMPSCRFLNGSFDSDLSLDFGNKARRVIRSELYRETFPEIEIRDDQDTKGYFANYQGGERRSTSTGAAIIGRHAHIHSVDDPIDPRGVRSQADLMSANQWMVETLPSRCVSQAVTPLWLVMQRLAIDDPTGERLNRVGGVRCKHICLPAEISDEVSPKIFRNKYKDGLLDPNRLPRYILRTKKAELGEFGYAGQFEQRPIPISGGMFKVDKFIVGELPPPPSDFTAIWRWWDKAATKEKYGAFTSGVLMGITRSMKSPRYWVLHVERGRWDTWQRERVMKQTAEVDRVKYGKKYKIGLEQEPGSAGKDSATDSAQNLDGFIVKWEPATGDKFQRADPYSTQVNAGNVALAPGDWNRPYIEEAKYFGPLCKYKDQIDASSACYKKLAKRRVVIGAGGF
jgi:predicted phage terminase large subunit-like protein